MNTTAPVFPAVPREAIRDLSGSLIREVANAGMGRSDVLPFWFGESDQPTPAFIRDAAVQSLQSGETFYSQNLGRPYLREAISAYLGNLHGREIGVERALQLGRAVDGRQEHGGPRRNGRRGDTVAVERDGYVARG